MHKLISKIFNLKNIPLTAIVLLAAFLRLYRITDTPPALNWDEVSHGYNAYSILTTGKDEWGNIFPVIFRAFGDYKLPVYIYLTAISEALFGLTELAVRLPSVLAGIGTVIFTYLLTLELFRKSNLSFKINNLALMSSLLTAVEPWSFFLSRGAFEANMALFFFVSGVYFFLKILNNSHSTFYILHSTFLLGLTVWTYNSYRVFTPLITAILVAVYWRDLVSLYKKSAFIVNFSLVVFALFTVPMFYQLFNSTGQARYDEVKIIDSGTIAKIEQTRSSGGSRFLHNKATYFLKDFGANYISHFSPAFLFSKGGDNYQFSIPGHGLLYPINIVFLLLGVYLLLTSSILNPKSRMVILLWLLIAPVPSSLTREAPHVLRVITLLPIPMILPSLGFVFFAASLKIKNWKLKIPLRYLLYLIYSLILVVSLGKYLYIYYGGYRSGYSWSWQYGYKDMVTYVKENYSVYDKIIITKKYGEPHEFLLFYMQINPENYRSDKNLNRFYQTNWYWVDSFDKFYFVNDWQINENGKGGYVFNLESKKQITCTLGIEKCLLVTSPGNVPAGWTKIQTIDFADNTLAFEMYENK